MTMLPASTDKKLGLVIDLDTCVGCHACVVNCKEWNTSGYGVPLSDQDPYGAEPVGSWLNRIHTFEVMPTSKPKGQGDGEVIGQTDEARVDLAFRRAIGRPPTTSEASLALNFLRESGDSDREDNPEAWAALTRALFASVDFRYLR